jgi:hypothetical protein
MAFSREQLSRSAQAVRPDGSMGSTWVHFTDAAAATVAAAGYFNDARAKLSVGDIIQVGGGFGGTVFRGVYTVATVPTSGNVTVTGGIVTTT